MNHGLVAFLTAVALVGQACSQDPTEPPQDPVREMFKVFEEHGLKVDPAAGTITIPTTVAQPDQPLEFLLIHQRGKAHEAMLITTAKASVLNAALLMLGFEPGKNARVVDRDPLPTPEEVRAGAPIFDVFPPEGMPVWFTAKWTRIDGDGNEVEIELPVEDLIVDLSTERTIDTTEWIYLGGQMAPLYRDEDPVFIADYEGNYISVVYKSPANHLVTMKHERAVDDQIWWVSDKMPVPGTEVALVVHKQKTKLHTERDARIAERK